MVLPDRANNPVILVIDDSPDDRENYLRKLKQVPDVSYSCLEASEGMTGVEMIGSANPDCVLLDYSLPGHNGLEILKRIRERHAYLPVILLTGQGNEAVAVQAIKDGASNYFVKSSASLDTLHGAIKDAINHGKWKQELAEKDQQNAKLLEKLAAANTELERFAYVASHDMQEPLRMIVNFSEMVSQEYSDKLDDQGKEYLRLVTDSAARMQKMVGDLLEYARLGKEAIRFVPFDAAEELKHVLENLSATIMEYKAEITSDNLPKITGEPVQFMRLLQNLIGNGLKYQSPGNIPRIHIRAEDKGADWLFSVSDNGIGIDETFLKEIFEPFRRLHTWDQIKGIGLGLTACKKIIENHNGTLWVTSAPDKGSIFHFTIPKSIPARGAEK